MKKFCFILLMFIGFSALCDNSGKEKSTGRVLSGKVETANGEPITGAKIIILETGESFFSDLDGHYKLTIETGREYTISINTIGYQPLEVRSSGLTSFSDLQLNSL